MAEVAGLLGSQMQPVPGIFAVRKEMQQHVSAEEAAAVTETEAENLWQLMLEREHLRGFDRLLPPWQPPRQAGGGALDEDEVRCKTLLGTFSITWVITWPTFRSRFSLSLGYASAAEG